VKTPKLSHYEKVQGNEHSWQMPVVVAAAVEQQDAHELPSQPFLPAPSPASSLAHPSLAVPA
jgi:hypothetical protein